MGGIITFAAVFSISFYLTKSFEAPQTYGALKHEIRFDKANITRAEVDNIADALTQTTFFDEVQKKYVFVEKKKESYFITLSVLDGIAQNEEALQFFTEFRNEIQKLFPDHKIVLNLAVNRADNVVKRLE